MVYCGKASLGCLSCRKRRIKCDRRQPECTQCVRLSKACPGYRDQLSLMFRDETVKVEKRVRASWGMSDQSSSASSSSSASRSAPARSRKSTTPPSAPPKRSESAMPTPPDSAASASPVSTKSTCTSSERSESRSPTPAHAGAVQRAAVKYADTVLIPAGPCQKLATAPADLGVSFYVQHYLIGYPDEVRNPAELSGISWFQHPSAQEIMAALGLASLGNINGDKQMQHQSKIKYGTALKATQEILQDPVNNLDTAIRTTVMLALFQCIHLTHESHESARVHLMGCMALLKSALPIRTAPANGIRGVLQLCYSLLYPCVMSGTTMPSIFFESIRDGVAAGFVPDYELPGVSLIHTLARFTELSAKVQSTSYSDGRDSTADMMRQLLAVDEALDGWEWSQEGKWQYQTYTDASLPPEAVFRGTYHRYDDVWTSRIWNHYRWAHIVTNEMLLQFADRYPVSAAAVRLTPARRALLRAAISRLAVDLMTSVPTHYKHPRLTWSHLDAIQTHGGAGAGAVGIPHLMFHLQVAACAPGVPYDVWKWGVDTMEMVWAELGMLHAKSLAEISRKHRANLDKLRLPESVLKTEPGLAEVYDLEEAE